MSEANIRQWLSKMTDAEKVEALATMNRIVAEEVLNIKLVNNGMPWPMNADPERARKLCRDLELLGNAGADAWAQSCGASYEHAWFYGKALRAQAALDWTPRAVTFLETAEQAMERMRKATMVIDADAALFSIRHAGPQPYVNFEKVD